MVEHIKRFLGITSVIVMFVLSILDGAHLIGDTTPVVIALALFGLMFLPMPDLSEE